MKRIFIAVIAVGIAFLTLHAGGDNTKVENFSLKDVNGVSHSLVEYQKHKAVVVMFIATQCPISNAYNERMVKLYREYSTKEIAFVAVNSNKQESVEEIKLHAKEHGFEFPILKDVNNVVADRMGATVTPEIYLLNPSLEIVYHGRIDDSRRASDVKTRDLEDALNEVLSGKPVSHSRTRAFGCTIKRIDS